jgi:hypothetical protein
MNQTMLKLRTSYDEHLMMNNYVHQNIALNEKANSSNKN